MTDDKEDKTLECQEHFTEVAKSRDVEVCIQLVTLLFNFYCRIFFFGQINTFAT